jgi:hypothetical protein
VQQQQPAFRKSFSKLSSVEMPLPAQHVQHQRRQFAKNVYSSTSITLATCEQAEMLPLGKVQQMPTYSDMGTPMTRSTVCSSNGGSGYNSENESNFEFDNDAINALDSPCRRTNSYQQQQ